MHDTSKGLGTNVFKPLVINRQKVEIKMPQRILIGITGSIVTVGIHNYLMEIQKFYSCEINIILSNAASKLITPQSLSYFIDGEIFNDSFQNSKKYKIPHVHLAEWADLILIMPATANIIGKLANGIADDLISLTLLAAECPVVICPNMNGKMYSKNSVQRNVNQLKDDGYMIMESNDVVFQLSNSKNVKGTMPRPENFVTHLERMINDATNNYKS